MDDALTSIAAAPATLGAAARAVARSPNQETPDLPPAGKVPAEVQQFIASLDAGSKAANDRANALREAMEAIRAKLREIGLLPDAADRAGHHIARRLNEELEIGIHQSREVSFNVETVNVELELGGTTAKINLTTIDLSVKESLSVSLSGALGVDVAV
ncbi:MAG: hypothetical protein KDE22_06595 [Rhodobacterales bacterium]|nr:hypothetical protein [Rhodobacterales bacterium]